MSLPPPALPVTPRDATAVAAAQPSRLDPRDRAQAHFESVLAVQLGLAAPGAPMAQLTSEQGSAPEPMPERMDDPEAATAAPQTRDPLEMLLAEAVAAQLAPTAWAQGPLQSAAQVPTGAGAAPSGTSRRPDMPVLPSIAMPGQDPALIADTSPPGAAILAAVPGLPAYDPASFGSLEALSPAVEASDIRQPQAAAALLPPNAEPPREPIAGSGAHQVRFDGATLSGARAFADDVGNRLVWMVSNGRQVAELRVDPPQLGPLEVRLSISQDEATLTLLSPHPAVRDALQASVPRLQDMLQAIGVTLDSVFVGTQDNGHDADAWRSARQDSSGSGAPRAGDPSGAAPAEPRTLRFGLGAVDIYA